MPLPRPHIPIGVRVEVAAQQLSVANPPLTLALSVFSEAYNPSGEVLLYIILAALFNRECHRVHLDHDPPLMLREFNPRTGKYKPDANDPRYLVYRTAEEHRIKTFVHGDGAQLSDAGKRRKEIKRQRKLAKNVIELDRHRAPSVGGVGRSPWRPSRPTTGTARLRPSRWPPKGSRPLRPK